MRRREWREKRSFTTAALVCQHQNKNIQRKTKKKKINQMHRETGSQMRRKGQEPRKSPRELSRCFSLQSTQERESLHWQPYPAAPPHSGVQVHTGAELKHPPPTTITADMTKSSGDAWITISFSPCPLCPSLISSSTAQHSTAHDMYLAR